MKFSRDQATSVTIRHVQPGRIRVGNETVDDDVVLTVESEIRHWQAREVAELRERDFADVLDEDPEMIVLGTGWKAEFPPRELVFALARRGVGLETMDTPAACRTFNILVSEGRRAAAFLIVNDRA